MTKEQIAVLVRTAVLFLALVNQLLLVFGYTMLPITEEELNAFLFSLGCYSGEPITVISHLKNGCIVSIKDSRYHIDKQLAQAIAV